MAKKSEVVKYLGKLKPNAGLLARVAAEGLDLNHFTGQAEAPPELVEFIAEQKLRTTESSHLFFAHNAGVGMHYDDTPCILWVLCGTNGKYMNAPSHQMIVDGEEVNLKDGGVYWFHSGKKHGVIAQNCAVWACLSVRVTDEDD